MSAPLLPQDAALAAIEQVRIALPGAEVGAEVQAHEMALTRFAESVIHQNVSEELISVRLTVHHDGRTATSSGTVVDSGDVEGVVARLVGAVGVAPRDVGWPGLAGSAAAGDSASPDPATSAAGPVERAEAVRAFVDGAGGLQTAGYCRTTTRRVAFANSDGHLLSGEAAECGIAGVARAPLADGAMADGVARMMPASFADLDAHALGARAAAKARAWTDPVELDPGRYEVVLEPDAVADLLGNLASWGFNGRMVTERRSFVDLGADQLDPSLTLVDDPGATGVGFDSEGTPSERLTLVESGRPVAVAHDRRTAAEAGGRSTGHSMVGWLGAGAMPRQLGILPSGGAESADEVEGPICDSSTAELVAGMERGILVSDLWYTRVLDSRKLVLTGLTRNGVWLVEDGQVVAPVKNFRFTQSYSEALAPGQVLGIGRTSTPIPGDTYSATSPRFGCPALRLASWNFTGGASG